MTLLSVTWHEGSCITCYRGLFLICPMFLLFLDFSGSWLNMTEILLTGP